MRKHTRNTDEWGTPRWLFDLLDREFVFHVDVCASAKNRKAPIYFNKRDNGLNQKWLSSAWCNPPYSNQIPWIAKADLEYRQPYCNQVVMLLKHDPSTTHGKMVANLADELRIIQHRIKFEGAPNTAEFPSCIAIFRKRLYTRKSEAKIYYVDYRPLIRTLND